MEKWKNGKMEKWKNGKEARFDGLISQVVERHGRRNAERKELQQETCMTGKVGLSL